MNITVEKIQDAFDNQRITGRYNGKTFVVDSWFHLGYCDGIIIIDGVDYRWKSVKDFGGEGEGDTRYVVFSIGKQLFRMNGWYDSHYGSEFDGPLEEVEAFERTVTDYWPVGRQNVTAPESFGW